MGSLNNQPTQPMWDKKYKIQRLFFEGHSPQTIKTGLTLEEAQEHCSDPETSSRTCSPEKLKQVGADTMWFDSYTEQ